VKKANAPAADRLGKKRKPSASTSRQTQIDRLVAANAKVQMEAAQQAVQEQGAHAVSKGADPDAERTLFRAMIDQVPDYLFVKDTESRFVIANRAVAADLGRKPEELIGLTDFSFHQPDIARKFYTDEQRLIHSGEALINIEDLVVDFEGKKKWFATSKVPLRDSGNRIIGLVGVCRDITDRKQAEEQMHFMALHDGLTGLPNRSLFMERLSQGIRLSDRTGQRLTTIFIDLDNFKTVNDSLGHSAGDTLLKVVAQRMVGAVRASDTVARFGGDEFVILLVDQDKPHSAPITVLEKIRLAIAEPVVIKGQSFRITGSIGVAGYPEDGTDAETLLLNADIAMYEAKANGRDNFQFYTKGIDDAARERRLLRDHLLDAITRNEFSLLYQPQVDLETERIFAVEALLRWNHPTLGVISPDKFIPLAEENGLIVALGNWVLREACQQNKAWQDAGLPPITVCVNVSARQMIEGDWVRQVTDILHETGLEPRYLELELTESMLMHDVHQAVVVMHELQSLGVNFAIDDFGTGYSSLSALKSLPVVRLKIDRSFINNLTSDPNDQNIAKAVILLGQNLNMRVIAEGVETDEQLAFLRENHCDEAQGYHFSKPLRPDAIA
jgi:diguanylate cyclase (GGDEF)-like protein/PAS domain S-box-containing protein